MIIMYGTEQCPNCIKVKKYLEENNHEYGYKTVNVDIMTHELQEIIGRIPRSVPIITMDDIEVDFDELKSKLSVDNMISGLGDLEL